LIGDGAPVVLKASGGLLAHKSEVGGVRLGVVGAAAARRAYQELLAMTGGEVLVCEQVTDGVAEVVVGVSRDALFGPVIAVGLGGVLVEVLGDLSFRVPPFERAEAARMLDELRGIAVLRGARGRPKADEKAIVDVVLKVQRLAFDLREEIREIDINPLIVRARGRGAVAVDALVVPG
jgi:acyl-CoA synthetase (NDP forming)